MTPARKIARYLSVSADRPELVRAQSEALTRHVPLLYGIVAISCIALAQSFRGQAPILLWLYIPSVIVGACVVRIWRWSRLRPDDQSIDKLVSRLRRMVWFALAFGLVCDIWALNLNRYADALGAQRIEFFISITLIGCVVCMTYLPAAALALAAGMIGPLLRMLTVKPADGVSMLSINGLLVCAAVLAGLLVYFRDFDHFVQSKSKLSREQLENERLTRANLRLANLDSLTGLPNRRRFFDEVEGRSKLAARTGARLVVGLINLDGFKPVNEVHGHGVGDQVLVEVARRLTLHCDDALVARLGGDEFALVLDDYGDGRDLIAYGETICAALGRAYSVGEVSTRISASIGLSAFPDSARTVGQLIERADYALQHARKLRAGAAALFSAEHERELKDAMRIEQALRDSDLERELSVLFQPLCDSHTHRTTAFEALARWNSAVLGPVEPSVFIATAEKAGLISQITPVLLAKALAAARAWPEEVRLSFNLSARDLISREAIAAVRGVLEASGVAPGRVIFEITETAVMSDFQRAADALLALRDMGCGVSLDDFGTGHSSLSYVHRLPLDKIKIDRSFVSDIETSGLSRGIVKTIVDMCRNLQLECVMEGVETPGQLLLLRQFGCRTMQGWLFGRPMSSEAALRHLADEAEDDVIEPAQPLAEVAMRL